MLRSTKGPGEAKTGGVGPVASWVRPLRLPEEYRLLVTSDVHGNLSLLQSLLRASRFGPEDHLLVLGDLIDKGWESSAQCLRALFRLQEENERVHLLQGNCDNTDWMFALEDEPFWRLATQRRGGLLRHWALEDGLPLERERVGELRQGLLRAHGRELDRLRGLPYALETEDFLFVHSGVKTPDYRNTPPQLLTKFNDFFFLARPIGKWVVFGHMPANNFRQDGRMTPYVDKGRKLIAIDGGNAINRFGQLNGLLIEKRAGELFFETIFADAHGRARALRSVRGLERKDCAATSYLDGRIERVLSENAHFVLCSLKRSGRRSYIKREWLRRQDGELVSTHACPQALLRLREGEEVYLCEGGLSGFDLAKKMDGQLGWVEKGVLAPIMEGTPHKT